MSSTAFAEVLIVPSSSAVDEGTTFLAACVGNGNPLPDISWSKGDDVLTNGSLSGRATVIQETIMENGLLFVQSVLELCSLEVADFGTYTCTVANSLSSDSATFVVNVDEFFGKICVSTKERVYT